MVKKNIFLLKNWNSCVFLRILLVQKRGLLYALIQKAGFFWKQKKFLCQKENSMLFLILSYRKKVCNSGSLLESSYKKSYSPENLGLCAEIPPHLLLLMCS